MSEKYLIGEWVAFIQQIHHLVARGYTEYCLVDYPIEKKDKFLKIDKKLISKYDCNLNKDKTHYNKQKGNCNFKFLRWQHTGIFLKTPGKPKKEIVIDDEFNNVKKIKIRIGIGPKTNLLIGYNGKDQASVFLDKESYREVRATCLEYIDRNHYSKMVQAFNNLNGLPAWGGIVEQKIQMKEYLVKRLKKNVSKDEVAKLASQMRINTKRTAVKVF